jgi:hypothetical protein
MLTSLFFGNKKECTKISTGDIRLFPLPQWEISLVLPSPLKERSPIFLPMPTESDSAPPH